MLSQSLFAQLVRLLLLLLVTLFVVHHNQPLIDALAKHATSGGCHQQNLPKQHINHQHRQHH
ncbi:hypothetical protein [Psychromonas hadalis]|uniref:hypothetical protein n=1 Tax=Psychromonas hadalis TaxID=211669 RepID=UPI0003B4FBFF|nr:hypothetical protein [Psychromonas hadalis]